MGIWRQTFQLPPFRNGFHLYPKFQSSQLIVSNYGCLSFCWLFFVCWPCLPLSSLQSMLSQAPKTPSRSIPLSHLGKRKETFSDKLAASCKPALSQAPVYLRLSILHYYSLGENFPQGARTTLTSDWTASPEAEGKLESSRKSLNACPVSVSWLRAKKKHHKLIPSLPISSPYHRGAVALAFHCFPTDLKNKDKESEMP